MGDRINLRCDYCGNAMRVERAEDDPPAAVEVVTNECTICDAASGGFGETWYFDAEGNEVLWNDDQEYVRSDYFDSQQELETHQQ